MIQGSTTEELGISVLKSRGFVTQAYWYWIGAGALVGFLLVFNIVFMLALAYLNRGFLRLFRYMLYKFRSFFVNDVPFVVQHLERHRLYNQMNQKAMNKGRGQEKAYSQISEETAQVNIPTQVICCEYCVLYPVSIIVLFTFSFQLKLMDMQGVGEVAHLQGQELKLRPVVMGKEEWFFHLINILSHLMILYILLTCHR